MEMKPIEEIETAEEARELAIAWQEWQSEQALSYGEMYEWQGYFMELATKFGLAEEFVENGII